VSEGNATSPLGGRRIAVVGGAGFIGSHLTERLANDGAHVTVLDDLSVGRREHLEPASATGRVTLRVGDARSREVARAALAGQDAVVHLAANPEARAGLLDPRLDLELGLMTTLRVAEEAGAAGVRHLVFASSGTVYGPAPLEDRPSARVEDDLGSLPISLYGASKLASEAFLSAHAECFGLSVTTLRFGNVVGPRATHGVILDLCRKLRASPHRLEVLGDGRQEKPYLHVSDCVDGLRFALSRDPTSAASRGAPYRAWNLAPASTTTVARIATLVVAASPDPRAEIVYAGGPRGWPGDVPLSRMDPSLLAELGFRIECTSDAAVERAVREIAGEVFGR
jgi:UDP-glucose 4-epimerase